MSLPQAKLMAKSMRKSDEYSSTDLAPASESDIDSIRMRSEKNVVMKARQMRNPPFVSPETSREYIFQQALLIG